MTTQHTHHERNDVDQSIVEHLSASETTTVSSTNSPPEIQGEGNTLSSDTVHPVAEQAEPDADSQIVQGNTAVSSEMPSASSAVTPQIHESTQNREYAESVNSIDTATDVPVTPETFPANSTVAYEDEIVQVEAEATPSNVPHEAQVQHDKPDSTGSTEVETQQVFPSNDSTDAPVELKADIPTSLEGKQEQSGAVVIAQIDIHPSDQGTPSEINGQGQAIAPTEAQDEMQTTAHDEKPEGVEQPIDTGEIGSEAELIVAEAQSSAVSIPTEEAQAATAHQSEQSFSYTEIAPLINAKAEEVRPFTEFIEEFRQAEAARLQSTLREPQVEAFALLNSVESQLKEAAAILENVEGTEKIEGTFMQAEAKPSTNTESKETAVAEQKTIIDPANRPVSPLLRPATRLRVPRHGLTRHQREEQQAAEMAAIAAQKAQSETQEPGATSIPAPISEPISPKPARRYRFDRPSSTTKNAPATSSSTTAIPSSNGNASAVPGVTAEVRASGVARLELSTQTQTQQEIIPEAKISIEPTIVTTPPAPEQGRRRHTHKEQAVSTPTPVVEIPAPIVEPVTPTDEVPPEDLPPLEYAELQKASNSRRRRRHRSGSASATSAIAATSNEPSAAVSPILSSPLASPQIAPMPQIPSSPFQAPQTPVAPYQNVTTNNPYNIVSGYTLNQMNQGNEIVGPFMGPEPSPARGSVLSRDGRTIRAESQRTPTMPSTTSFPGRSTEHTLHGPSAASMTQFANIVSQAIQTQTDRMVAELRRANQGPTNVSVSLPPFPSTERVGVFVDVANLLYSARTLRIAVDFGKLLDFLRGNRRLIRAHAYCPTSPQPGDEQMFLQAVKGLGYRITTKNYKTFSSGAKKADLDLDLCMDVVRLVDGRAVDCIVLVSGDSDFMPMLDYCSDHGVRVEVAAFDEAMSATLRQSCDLFVNLSMLEEIRA